MAIILDADVIIRGEKGLFDLTAWLQSRADDSFEIAAITVAELWHGVERATGSKRVIRERYLQTIISVLPIAQYTQHTAFIHARLWAELETQGSMIGCYDLIVAATAIERQAEVATFNVRHFSRVPGLKIVKPA